MHLAINKNWIRINSSIIYFSQSNTCYLLTKQQELIKILKRKEKTIKLLTKIYHVPLKGIKQNRKHGKMYATSKDIQIISNNWRTIV